MAPSRSAFLVVMLVTASALRRGNRSTALEEHATSRRPSLELRRTSSYEESYSDRGTGSRQDLSVWRPRLFNGEHRLLYTGTNSRHRSSGTFVVKGHNGALKQPNRFVCKWTDRRTGGSRDGSLWQAIAPSGYICLSDVAIHVSNHDNYPGRIRSANEIDSRFRCVHNSLVRKVELGGRVWTDAGSGGVYDGAVWSIRDSVGMRVGRGAGDVPPHQQSTLKDFVGELWRDIELIASVCNPSDYDNGPFNYTLEEGRVHTSGGSVTRYWENEMSATARAGVGLIVRSSFESTIRRKWGQVTSFSWSATSSRKQTFHVGMRIPKRTCSKLFQLVGTDSGRRGDESFKIRARRWVICQDPVNATVDCVGTLTA